MDRAAGTVVIVGASAAGTATALNLRRLGHAGPIALLGDEHVAPYDRPPLSKGVLLGAQGIDEIGLATPQQFAESEVDVRLGARVTGIDRDARELHLDDGGRQAYDTLVIATGASPRRLPRFDGFDNVHHLRRASDAQRLGAKLTPGKRLGIVGGGLIGLEVAASARSRGLAVTVVEPAELPLGERLTAPVARWLLEQHRAQGVELHLGRTVADLVAEDAAVTGLVLDDGTLVGVDDVLVAIGAVPNVSWLASSGLEIENGVRCDAHQRVAEGIYAVGDVANTYHPSFGRHLRLETRTNAAEGALQLAQTLTGVEEPYAPVPFFWTDQYGFRLQAFGLASPDDDLELVDGGRLDDERWIAVGRRHGRLAAVIAKGGGKALVRWRRELQQELSSENDEKVTMTHED